MRYHRLAVQIALGALAICVAAGQPVQGQTGKKGPGGMAFGSQGGMQHMCNKGQGMTQMPGMQFGNLQNGVQQSGRMQSPVQKSGRVQGPVQQVGRLQGPVQQGGGFLNPVMQGRQLMNPIQQAGGFMNPVQQFGAPQNLQAGIANQSVQSSLLNDSPSLQTLVQITGGDTEAALQLLKMYNAIQKHQARKTVPQTARTVMPAVIGN